MNAGKVSLADAALKLGKGPRQVRRYVESGQLRASGGGHGIPYQFAQRDIEAFTRRMKSKTYQRRQTWRGRVDGDTLARIAHASALRQDNPGEYLHYVNGGFLSLWTLPQKTVQGLFRNCLPPLDSVPDSTRLWASRLAARLSPVELDYVGSMFIVRLNPATGFEKTEAGALGAAMEIVKQTRPYLFYNEKTFQQSPEAWAGIADSVQTECRASYAAEFAGEMYGFKRSVFFGQDRASAWQVYAAHHPVEWVVRRLTLSVHAGDVEWLRSLIVPNEKRPPAYPEADKLRDSLTAATKRMRQLRKRQDRNPSGNRVGQVLGLKYRAQGCRVARRVRDKLSRDDILSLFVDHLRCDAPRVWKSRPTRTRPAAG